MPSHGIFGIARIPIQPPDPGLRGLQANGQPSFGQLLHPTMNVENGLGPFRKPVWDQKPHHGLLGSGGGDHLPVFQQAPDALEPCVTHHQLGLATGVGPAPPVVVDVVKHHRTLAIPARNTMSLSTFKEQHLQGSCFTLVAEHPVDAQGVFQRPTRISRARSMSAGRCAWTMASAKWDKRLCAGCRSVTQFSQ